MTRTTTRETATSPVHMDATERAGGVALALTPRQQVLAFTVIVASIDLLLLMGNVAHFASNAPGEAVNRFSRSIWDGDLDGSFVEIFGHMQILAGVVLLSFLFVARRAPVYGAWALVLLMLGTDDFVRIHEKIGAILVRDLDLPAVDGLRSQDLGELLVWAGEAVIPGILVIIATMAAGRAARRDSIVLIGCTLILAVFAVGLDQVHIIIEPHVSSAVATVLTLAETAGELGSMSLLVLVIHRMAVLPRRADVALAS